MLKGTKTTAKQKQAEPSWEESGLTTVEQSQAHHLVVQLQADGKLETPSGATGPSKRNLARVVAGMAMVDDRWAKFKNTEVTWKAKKYMALYKLVHAKSSRLAEKPEASGTP